MLQTIHKLYTNPTLKLYTKPYTATTHNHQTTTIRKTKNYTNAFKILHKTLHPFDYQHVSLCIVCAQTIHKLYTKPYTNPTFRWFSARYEMYSLRFKLYTNYTQTLHCNYTQPSNHNYTQNKKNLHRRVQNPTQNPTYFLEHEAREMFRNWTNEWKTKTGKTPCAWCKWLWRAFDAVPAGNSRASSGFSAGHIIPLSGCIHRKAINKTFSQQEPHCEFIKCKASATEP